MVMGDDKKDSIWTEQSYIFALMETEQDSNDRKKYAKQTDSNSTNTPPVHTFLLILLCTFSSPFGGGVGVGATHHSSYNTFLGE